ncbi:chloride channel protein [Chitinophaga flava]|uniref:Chloride channel protein n=1 Tax=Chitinophaga flava TaxID=2259036 RepID=A0A365Y5S9_9BACT|nr:chloride channel protein [Chitinophaga flava]RBL93245.1 hypothetical protein DF182_11955 [Chitinophaga flava]
MKNIQPLLYRNGLGIHSVLSEDKENFKIALREGHLRRTFYLSALGAGAGLLTVGAGMLLSWLVRMLTGLAFFGKLSTDAGIPADSEAGIWLLLIPVAGAFVSLFLFGSRYPTWKLPALAICIGTGAPVGTEGPVMVAAGAFVLQDRQRLRISEAEARLLLVAGAAAGVAWYFGAPVSALVLALELWLGTWSLILLLPVLSGVIVGGVAHYCLSDMNPFFTMESSPALNAGALLVYIVLGLIIGLIAALMIRASRGLARLFNRLKYHSPWWLLLAAVPVGIAGYLAPESLGSGEVYGNNLLQAHVTLQLVFVVGVVKLITWLFFTSGYNTGTTITPLLMIGGALGLLLAVVAQFVCPSIVINPAVAALIGMSAMFAGISRAWLTAIILALELTHCLPAVLPVACAAIAAFVISFPLIKTKQHTAENKVQN